MASRYEREIEDILKKFDQRPARETLWRRAGGRVALCLRHRLEAARWGEWRAAVSTFMLGGILLVVMALFCGLLSPLWLNG